MAPAPASPLFDDMSSSASLLLAKRADESRIDPTADQRTLIIVACVYAVVIVLLWNIPYLKMIIYPFKLLTVGFHEFGHAFMGVLTCAHIESIHLDPNEGGATRMRGGIPWLTLPAGYLGSSLIGAAMIATSFDIRAAKVMTLIIAVFFLLTLWWARKDWLTWVLLLCMAGLIVAFWFIAHGVALQYLVLFIGVMSCLYSGECMPAPTLFFIFFLSSLSNDADISCARTSMGHLRRSHLPQSQRV